MALIVKISGLPSLSTLWPPQSHKVELQSAEAIEAGDACRINSDGKAEPSIDGEDVWGFAATSCDPDEPVTLFHSERFAYCSVPQTPGTKLYLSASTAGALDTTADASGKPVAVVHKDGVRVWLLQRFAGADSAEAAEFFGNIPQAAESDLAGTNLTAVPGSFADVAAVQTYLATLVPEIETRLDNIETKVNSIITKLENAGILT